MPLVFAFALIVSGVVSLSMGITGANAGEVFQGKARQVYETNAAASNSTSDTSAGATSTSTVSGGAVAGSVTGQVGQVTPAMLAAIGKAKGWTASELADWMGVIKIESGGNPTAQNPTSDAYGIAQGIDGPSWYAAHGGSVSSVTGQLTAMANYIESRYGTPAAALEHEHTNGWY